MKQSTPAYILPVIVLAQFAGTSLWFAGNAVVNDLSQELRLAEFFVGYITMAVQAGFISGTLLFAILTIADRYSPVLVFLVCSLAGSTANIALIGSETAVTVLIARFMTGFFLAGIYPVGMKIASDWHREGLGKALGYLVGALVVGTAFPHLLKYLGGDFPWRNVITGTSILASSGGIILFLTVSDGPYRRSSAGLKLKLNAFTSLFRNRNFRSAAFGYFGHMWELYTFWAFVPVILNEYLSKSPDGSLAVSLWSFAIIGIGGISCAVGGHLSSRKGSKWVSMVSLSGSGLCCLLIPFGFSMPLFLFLGLLLAWGFFVVSDSPQFSALVARSSDSSLVATGLTIVNSIGFALTILSIQLFSYLWQIFASPFIFWLIAIGPLAGLYAINQYRAA
jgi:MFS family permease